MRSLHSLVAAGLLAAVVIVPMTAVAAEPSSDAVLDQRADAIFDLLKAGKGLEAFDASLGLSPLMAGKEAERQALAAQFEAAIRVYGPITAVEKVKQTTYGSMQVKRFYVVQHEKMLTRWELNFSRLKTGWVVTYFGFEDQARTWE